MNNRPTLDPDRFDAITSGRDRLWGLTAIAAFIGVSVDKARRLATRTDAPIYQPDGKSYFALRSELMAWLRTKA